LHCNRWTVILISRLKMVRKMIYKNLIKITAFLFILLIAAAVSTAAETVTLGANNAPAKTITLGSIDPNSGFKFQLELVSKGAAINKATFSEFSDCNNKNPKPLVILSPLKQPDGSEIASMANMGFIFTDLQIQLNLDKLQWVSFDGQTAPDGSQSARFEATIKLSTNNPVIKITKIYRIYPKSYQIDCNLAVENMSLDEQKVQFNMAGAMGLGRDDTRSDTRKAVAGFKNSKGEITSQKIDISKLHKAKTTDDLQLVKGSDIFLWAAVVNKYFCAIVVPLPDKGKSVCNWIVEKSGQFYNPDRDPKADTGDETLGLNFKIAPAIVAAGASQQYNFQIYLGPKDNQLFSKNERYRNLGFVHTIDFMACCCPISLIQPLSLGILQSMEWMHRYIPNYGIVIIILVFIIRIVIHPLTKHSQVAMSKMQKLGPRVEEIKKKYANNKTELNKQVMALYKEQGASPIMGFLPMLVQMPIWIALYSAIYSSIALRGAAFLPFWITDLSAPDALFRFKAITLPLFGRLDSFNFLPILMGLAFYFQQKMMPAPQTTSTSPQLAQQQKMMMVMMPLMFPLMLYTAPSGLNLYIMASTFAGVIEQYIIKKHIREKEENEAQGLVAATSKTGGKVKKKKPKPFFKM
jgi:YidC/Oxa1 family membrane protein insertase